MQTADIEYQAQKLHDYVRRGGSSKDWMRSKGFRGRDQIAILEASARMTREDIAARGRATA
jgi:hypothetical protein